MYIREALKVFHTRGGLFRALGGARHRSAVYQWREDKLIPLGAALLLARAAREKGITLLVNLELYDRAREKHR